MARDPQHLGVEIGFFAVLHSWGQNLHFHPHLHCIVPGGGLSVDHDRWIPGRPGFFLPVKVLSRWFRRLFLEALEKAYAAGQLQFFGHLEPLRDPPAFARYLAPLKNAEWVVYAKPPPHPLLRLSGQLPSRRKAGAMPPAAGHCLHRLTSVPHRLPRSFGGAHHQLCPRCGVGILIRIQLFPCHGPVPLRLDTS
jgi:hypothetical protein